MRASRILLLLSSLVVASGCPAPEPEVEASAFASELEGRVCAWLSECGVFPDAASCAQAELVAHDLAQLSGRVDYDGGAAARCLDEVASLGCGQFPVGAFYFGSYEGEDGLHLGALHALGLSGARSCEEVFEGDAPVGASCFLPDECASEACERRGCEDACCTGTCVESERDFPDGSECNGDLQCRSGSYCGSDDLADVRSCRPRPQVGEHCTGKSSCGESAYCGADAICHALGARGEACDPERPEAYSSTCQRMDDYCDPASRTCTPLPGPGEACADVGDFGSCGFTARCDSGICVARHLVGEDCSVSCLELLECGEQGTCEPARDPARCTCGDGILDPGETCDDGNTRDADGCAADCGHVDRCGDGIQEENEVCDDGNTRSGDGCSADCQHIERCGNGVVDPGEACDDSNLYPFDACDACQAGSCGSGSVDAGEICFAGPEQLEWQGLIGRTAAAGDLDGDGDVDVITASGSQAHVYLNLGQALPGFDESFALSGQVRDIALARLDADVQLDLVVATDAGLVVYPGDGQGGFAPPRPPVVATSLFSIVTGDLDGDGDLDVLASAGEPRRLVVLLGNGQGGFAPPVDYSHADGGHDGGPGDPRLADLDGDGDLDVVAFLQGPNVVVVRLNDGAGGLGGADVYPGGSSLFGIDVGDLSGDGKPDIALAGDELGLLIGQGDGRFAAFVPLPSGASVSTGIALTDLDRDGDLDVVESVVGTQVDGLRFTLQNAAGQLEPFGHPTGFASPQLLDLSFADLNGDGVQDILGSGFDDSAFLLSNP